MMSKFTDDEKIVAKHINKKYKWIARDKSGDLCIYCGKPTKSTSGIEWVLDGACAYLWGFEDLFKSVTWEDAEPTLIDDIYNPQILDDVERKYLTAVLKPLPKVKHIVKSTTSYREKSEFIGVSFEAGETMVFPYFEEQTMYKSMELDKPYTPEELGLNLEGKHETD